MDSKELFAMVVVVLSASACGGFVFARPSAVYKDRRSYLRAAVSKRGDRSMYLCMVLLLWVVYGVGNMLTLTRGVQQAVILTIAGALWFGSWFMRSLRVGRLLRHQLRALEQQEQRSQH